MLVTLLQIVEVLFFCLVDLRNIVAGEHDRKLV